ncbi:acyl-CoA dehydrogenase family protein [Schumannella sp. 10F1B-5-1]|uniref:acyl-CoA dehydrogenase family protein n=1 Tax=Schumannella sp. 10F1B-5-1 TaxID=2590780 RepID=UPI0011320CCC|nr:acyl-CoA dehydrogenase family protein [Schumannella sp. 10F1B-5-1]TPW78266.1 glutaryl-CoA dehydrogenase [Schumannella sp. 10F1B-5-1]
MTRLYETADVYDYESLLSDPERAALARLRAHLETEVAPIVDDHWERGEFPAGLPAQFAELGLLQPRELLEAGVEVPRPMFEGFRIMEIARVDAGVATYFSGQATMITSAVLHGATPEQRDEWMPRIRSYEWTGVFAITEPDHGSDVARGIQTTARRDGDEWVLDGVKMWIGSAAYASHVCVVARDADSPDGRGQRAFLVPTGTPGMRIEKIAGKGSLRIVDNALITLEGVRVPEELRLGRVERFGDVAEMLRHMRASVVWLATGVQIGAYEAALAYVREREQFGRPLAGFQLVQEKVARMLGNITACLGMCTRLAQLQEEGVYRDEDSAMAKHFVSARMRETVALARELCGGNGILLSTGVMRFFADAEAVYTYEGTNEISALVTARGATGVSAFV